MSAPPFHLAFPVLAIDATERFYVDVLGCRVGRRDTRWIDFDFYGHQLTAHLVDASAFEAQVGSGPHAQQAGGGTHVDSLPMGGGSGDRPSSNEVDGDDVPVRHFGAVLPWDEWHATRDRLERAGISIDIGPRIRFEGEVGEQATMFLRDPSGNAIELKSFRDPSRLFAV